MHTPTVTVLGATGYTGRLVAAEAVRQGLEVRLAGRRRAALQALADELDGRASVTVADVDDPSSLRALAQGSTLLVSTVGPYVRLGRPVVEAVLEVGCHYLDVSGEVPFLAWAHEQAERAAAAGVTLLPGFGFDGVPGDLLAGLAANHDPGPGLGAPAPVSSLGALAPVSGLGALAPVHSARVAYRVHAGRVSGGTARSVLDILAGGGAAWTGGRLVSEPVAARRWRVAFPEPVGPRGAVSFPAPEVVTVGRTTGARQVRAYLVVPGSVLAPAAARPVQALTRAAAGTPIWSVVQRAVERLPEGPDRQARARVRSAVLVELNGPAGVRGAWARMGDPYETTARIVVGVARRVLDRGSALPGVLTPTQALGGEAGDLLDEVGATWTRW